MLEEAAETSVAHDRAFGWRRPCRVLERQVAHALMGPELEIIGQVFVDKMAQMVLAEKDEMVEAFRLDREDPALGVSVQVRRSWNDLDDVDLLAGQDGVELGGEVGVKVVNQVRGPIRLLLGEEKFRTCWVTQRESGVVWPGG
jgi:hypothetical protein